MTPELVSAIAAGIALIVGSAGKVLAVVVTRRRSA